MANPMLGGGRGALLAAIRKGTELTSRSESNVTPSPSPIKTSGSESAAPTSLGDAISNAMAARRLHTEAEADSTGSEDSEWED